MGRDLEKEIYSVDVDLTIKDHHKEDRGNRLMLPPSVLEPLPGFTWKQHNRTYYNCFVHGTSVLFKNISTKVGIKKASDILEVLASNLITILEVNIYKSSQSKAQKAFVLFDMYNRRLSNYLICDLLDLHIKYMDIDTLVEQPLSKENIEEVEFLSRLSEAIVKYPNGKTKMKQEFPTLYSPIASTLRTQGGLSRSLSLFSTIKLNDGMYLYLRDTPYDVIRYIDSMSITTTGKQHQLSALLNNLKEQKDWVDRESTKLKFKRKSNKYISGSDPFDEPTPFQRTYGTRSYRRSTVRANHLNNRSNI